MTNFRFNIVYFLMLLALVAFYFYAKKGQDQVHLFYGVADNEETEINFDKSITVQKIYVEAGQSVKKGEPLMLVERSDLALKKQNLNLDASEVTMDQTLKKADYEAKIIELEAEKHKKRTEFEMNIKELKSRDDYNKWLSEDLKTINSDKTKASNTSPSQVKIASLETEMTSALAIYDTRIAQIQASINSIAKPYKLKMAKIRTEQSALGKERDRMTILAPSDGIIGNVRCRVGEHKSAFDVLISFYEKNPNLVVGYVQERLLVHVNEGDSLHVQSHMQPDKKYTGIISGLGYRVVEIPERLRRFPEIKTYGREVLIRIPSDNRFLQNEKVKLLIASE